MTSAPEKHTCGPGRILAMDCGEKSGRLACQTMRCSPADLMFDSAHRCMLAVHEARVFAGKQRPPRVFQLLQPLRPGACPPCTRSYLGSCSSANDELARPSQAADEEECLSPPAVVTDAQEALFWTSAASRVWVAAVWPQSMLSGSFRWPCGKPVW